MYRELLTEYDVLAAKGEMDMEKFASEVLEKEALLAALGKATMSLGKGLFGKAAKLAPKATGLIGKNIKQQGALGLGLSAGVGMLSGQKPLGAIADAVVPGLGEAKQFGSEMKALKQQNQLPSEMFRPKGIGGFPKAAADESGVDKTEVAEHFNSENHPFANMLMLAGLAGAGFGGAKILGAVVNHNPNLLPSMSKGFDAALGGTQGVARKSLQAFTKYRPVTDVVSSAVVGASKLGDSMFGKDKRNWDSVSGLPSKKKILGTMGMYMGGMLGVGMAEDYLTERVNSAINLNKKNDNPADIEPAVGSDGVDIVVGDRTYNRKPRDYAGNRRDYNNQRPNRDFSSNRPQRDYTANRVNRTEPISALEAVASVGAEDLEKTAMTDTQKRMLLTRGIRPAVTTGVTLFTLATLSRMLGRNLYGGMEKVRKDEEVKNTGRLVIDIPTADAKSKTALVKSASLEGVKAALDKKITDSRSPWVHKLDKLLSEEEAVKYKGKTGLAHWATEEIPFRALEGLAYAAPMTAVAIATGRNMKKSFEPIITDPNVAVPKGMTRITIEEHDEKEKEKKATSSLLEIAKFARQVDNPETGISEYVDEADDVEAELLRRKEKKPVVSPYITNNLKQSQLQIK